MRGLGVVLALAAGTSLTLQASGLDLLAFRLLDTHAPAASLWARIALLLLGIALAVDLPRRLHMRR